MLEIAEGVQYIHSEGIVHGDLRGVRIAITSINQFIIESPGKYLYRLFVQLPNCQYWIDTTFRQNPIIDDKLCCSRVIPQEQQA